MRRCTLLWLVWCVAPLAFAGPHTVPAAYTNAAHAHQVPPVMLYALSLTESATTLSFGRRPWPWTLNIAGSGERYATRAAACQALTTALTHTKIVDVGISQLNVHWQKTLFSAGGRFADPCAALNPYANLDAAAAILYHCHQRQGGSWIDAAGCYHRPAGGAPAARYRAAFKRELARLRNASVHVATGHTSRTARAQSVAAAGPAADEAHASSPSRVTWISPTHDSGSSHALD
ncbi:transglycosylase SLT domain-containing protein [Salinisphaera aquimarina]|uniref:Transglycosylase SLT domain-containing protein n=1 Tax=Salinisphaera aquimarina TaxID=2094031 RepID=A0ABV7EUH0_9GAMM